VNSADTLITANELLTRYGAHEKMAVWAMIETPHAVMNIKVRLSVRGGLHVN
jgi:citrate lyase beta subunit